MELGWGASLGTFQTDFVWLATLFSPYFKQLLKLQPVHMNVATLSPKKNNFLSLLGDFQ
jgi:hypothetical protein